MCSPSSALLLHAFLHSAALLLQGLRSISFGKRKNTPTLDVFPNIFKNIQSGSLSLSSVHHPSADLECCINLTRKILVRLFNLYVRGDGALGFGMLAFSV